MLEPVRESQSGDAAMLTEISTCADLEDARRADAKKYNYTAEYEANYWGK